MKYSLPFTLQRPERKKRPGVEKLNTSAGNNISVTKKKRIGYGRLNACDVRSPVFIDDEDPFAVGPS